MDNLFNFDINFPVPRFKYLLFVTLLPIPPDSYRDNAEQRLFKVCVRRTPLELACRIKIFGLHFYNRLARHCLPVGRDNTDTVFQKIIFNLKSNVIPKPALQQVRNICETDINTSM